MYFRDKWNVNTLCTRCTRSFIFKTQDGTIRIFCAWAKIEVPPAIVDCNKFLTAEMSKMDDIADYSYVEKDLIPKINVKPKEDHIEGYL